MNWYILSNSTDSDVNKIFPQTDGMYRNYDFNAPDSIWNLESFVIPQFTPDLDGIVIDKKTNVTDVISTGLTSSVGFLISKKVKDILVQFRLPVHIFYSARILFKKNLYDNYFWFHIGENNDHMIDFDSSEFILTHPLPFFRTEEISIRKASQTEILRIKSEYPVYELFPKKLALITTHARQDIYCFGCLYNKIYGNNNLANKLKEANVTGLAIKEEKMEIQ